MIWLWITLGVVAVVVGVPLLIGALTEREHSATVRRVYRATPEQVWAAITGFEEMATWRAGVTRVELLDPVGGKRRVREHTKFGPLTYELEVEDAPRKLVGRILDTDRGFGGSWTYEIAPAADGGGTELTIREDGFVDNLLFRFMARRVFGYEGTMRAYHESLRRRLEGAQ